MLKDCPVEAIHTFQVRTLGSMGYRTRVALSNKSHLRAELRTDYRVDVSVYARGQARTRVVPGVATLAADARVVLDCTAYEESRERDAILIFHLVPVRFAPGSTVDFPRADMMFLGGIQDHYVEYYRDDGCAAGVLYQTGPFNHPRFSPKSTTLIQAPKFYVSSELDSKLSLVNASADPAYDRVAQLKCTLVGPGVRDSWTEQVAPFEPALISVRDRLRARGVAIGAAPTFVCLYGLCENATLIPLTIQASDATGAIGIEHSLPPDYYAETMRGPTRARAVERLAHSSLFEGA